MNLAVSQRWRTEFCKKWRKNQVGGPGGEKSGLRLAACLGEYLFEDEQPPEAPNASNGDGAETSLTTCVNDRMGDAQTLSEWWGQRTRGKRVGWMTPNEAMGQLEMPKAPADGNGDDDELNDSQTDSSS